MEVPRLIVDIGLPAMLATGAECRGPGSARGRGRNGVAPRVERCCGDADRGVDDLWDAESEVLDTLA